MAEASDFDSAACLRRFAEDDAEAAAEPGRLAEEDGTAAGAALADGAP